MARANVAVLAPPSGYTSPGAGAAKVAYAAADVANGNRLQLTGREVLLVRNSGAGAHTVTIASSPDPQGRSGDITAYSIPAGETHAFGPFPETGWGQPSDGLALWVNADHAELLLAALRLPPIS